MNQNSLFQLKVVKSKVVPFVDILNHIRFYLLTNLQVQIDTHHQGKVRLSWVLLYPLLVEMDFNELSMLIFAYHWPGVAVLHRLPIKKPHVPRPFEILFIFQITANTWVGCCVVFIDCILQELALLTDKHLFFAIYRHMQIKLLGCNSPLVESEER